MPCGKNGFSLNGKPPNANHAPQAIHNDVASANEARRFDFHARICKNVKRGVVRRGVVRVHSAGQ